MQMISNYDFFAPTLTTYLEIIKTGEKAEN